MDRIVIIDGNSLINRAYYAMQRPMITKTGIYTQGIYGFLNMLNRILEDYVPEYIAVAWDKKAPTFRHKEYKEYKAGRKKMPPELAMQLPLIKEVMNAMKITNLEAEGFEADDIIGTVARIAEEEGLKPLIITGDKDAMFIRIFEPLEITFSVFKIFHFERIHGAGHYIRIGFDSFKQLHIFCGFRFS